ncbi:type II toxin-antitoxin system HicA family toxin [Dyadobacter fanqingshengii]|uniref:Type II toxin-antitoxin system HicA family toxin n=1 Tax=Dyadobacter fanqingshengii TaxID=2906443 RepID=A0A9X1T911_9BACT|nr:type II toxin-antitoxin system HicA family toxin [Dyadobacter fanqingshengii]MCF0040715.1 type II toxin-antitoxin system HicA family toxin [Dyadobacter fanqingshengii]USJ37548.1 type II toxin-antitoxin system HicA family toxin [Dyadobacter fanqingshengii]
MKSSEFHRLIRRNGWVCIRSNGSHYIYQKGEETYTVAYHGSKEMAEGIRLKTVKKMNLK